MVDILSSQTVGALAGDKVFWQQALEISVSCAVLGSEVVLSSHSERQEHVDGANLLVIDSGRTIGLLLDADPDDSSHVTDAGVHGGPNLAALPETVVRSVGSEGENQTNDDTKGWNCEGEHEESNVN